MGRKRQFSIHTGHGGLIGQSEFFQSASRGDNNETSFLFQQKRLDVFGLVDGVSDPDAIPLIPLVPEVPQPTEGSFSASFSESFSGGV